MQILSARRGARPVGGRELLNQRIAIRADVISIGGNRTRIGVGCARADGTAREIGRTALLVIYC